MLFYFKEIFVTYASTRTGKAASRSSSRQLGGRKSCTRALQLLGRGTSNVFIFGNANCDSRVRMSPAAAPTETMVCDENVIFYFYMQAIIPS